MSRYAKKQTIQDLDYFIQQFIKKNEEVAGDIVDALVTLDECIGSSKLIQDLTKFGFLFENILLKEDYNLLEGETEEDLMDDLGYPALPLLGYQTIGDLSFLGVLGGTDYGPPLYFILYVDNKNTLRGYIPKKGNAVNPISNLPFGEDRDADNAFAKSKGFESISEAEEKMYHFFDIDLLKEDIQKRIKIK